MATKPSAILSQIHVIIVHSYRKAQGFEQKMNEIFWLTVSFILILLFIYKPVKRVLNNIIDSHITNTKELLNRAEKAHDDAVKYLQKLEKDLEFQDKLNKEKLAQNEHLLNSIKLENDKKIEEEIKRQFIIAEMQRKMDEEVMIQEITSKFLLKNINNVVSEFSTKDVKNSEFLKQSLDKLTRLEFLFDSYRFCKISRSIYVFT